jgi:zinc/manganese transport system substrate-binding protein
MQRLFIAVLLWLSCSSSAYADKPHVVASFSILGDMVAQVGGDDIELTTLIGANSDPHAFSPSPAHAVTIARADLVVINGLGFEGWMERLITSSGYAGPVLMASEGVSPLVTGIPAHTDFHAWQDATNGKRYITNIRDALIRIDAKNAAGYNSRAQAAITELAQLDAWIKSQISSIPKDKRRLMTTHNSFGYYERAYGVTFIAPIGISTDSEPSAAEIASLVDQLRAEHLQAIFLENISANRLGTQLSVDTGTHIGGTLYSDALSDASGQAASYTALLRHNTQQMVAAMRKNN